MNKLIRFYYSKIRGLGEFIAKTKYVYSCGNRLDTLEFLNELYPPIPYNTKNGSSK